jgi:hypothetical protein
VASQPGISLHGNDDCDPFTALGADECFDRRYPRKGVQRTAMRAAGFILHRSVPFPTSRPGCPPRAPSVTAPHSLQTMSASSLLTELAGKYRGHLAQIEWERTLPETAFPGARVTWARARRRVAPLAASSQTSSPEPLYAAHGLQLEEETWLYLRKSSPLSDREKWVRRSTFERRKITPCLARSFEVRIAAQLLDGVPQIVERRTPPRRGFAP